MICVNRAKTWLTFVGLCAFLLGCNRSASTASVPAPDAAGDAKPVENFDTESGPFAAGKKVVVASGCFKCHAINKVRGPVGNDDMAGGPAGAGRAPAPGGPGKMMGRGPGPDLGQVGRNAEHSVEWLMGYIRDPKSIRENSRMPKFEDKINDTDLRSLAEYLASLK